MLPSHEEQGGLLAKRQKMLRGDPNAFVDPTELARYAVRRRLGIGPPGRFNQDARPLFGAPAGRADPEPSDDHDLSIRDLSTRAGRVAALKAAAKQKILILDGSWGVMFQKKGCRRPTTGPIASPTTTAR
jgi:hypothetical protein